MDSIGELLRNERVRRGWKLEELAAQTKICSRYLVAMEENQFDLLPGGILTRSFLRQYTRTLGLNEDEAIAYLKEQIGDPALPLPDPGKTYRMPYLPHLPMLVWLLLALAAGGILYKLVHVRANSAPPVRTDKHGRSQATEPPGIAAPPATHEDRTRSIPASIGGSPNGQVASSQNDAMHVVFTASEPVWISINSDGSPKYSGTIDGQQSKEFDSPGKMTVLVGNVGGLTILINGQRVALTGAHGQVRLLLLTPDGARVVPRTLPSDSENEDHTGPYQQ